MTEGQGKSCIAALFQSGAIIMDKQTTSLTHLSNKVLCYQALFSMCISVMVPVNRTILHLSHLMTKPTKWHVCSAKTNQPGHLPSLIRIFAVRMKKAQVLSYLLCAQRGLWSDWADAQADLSLRWAHSHFVGFVMRWLISDQIFSYTCMYTLSLPIHMP